LRALVKGVWPLARLVPGDLAAAGLSHERVLTMSQEKGTEPQAKESLNEMAARGVPLALIKAVSQAGSFALGLWDGTVFAFTEASLHGPWVSLKEVRCHNVPALKRGKEKSDAFCVFQKSVEVRLDSIVWVADSPWG
jgi:hypothetical protein